MSSKLHFYTNSFYRVYCKYHYLEGHETPTPEKELLHFLSKLYDPNWKWSQQYESEAKYQHDEIKDKNDCNFRIF